jgi:uncharacterized Zn finger protein
MRESAHVKGRRYLVEGRLLVKAVSPHHVSAICRGDSGVFHTVTADASGWSCSCPAARDCSHLTALRLVCTQPLPSEGPGP